MAWLKSDADFDPDAFQTQIIGIAAQLSNHDSGTHRHLCGQLLFTQQGCTRISLAHYLCLLPPTRAAWIPSGVSHRAVIQRSADYRSIYVCLALAVQLPAKVRVIEVSGLLREVLDVMSLAPFDTNWCQGKYAHLLELCLSEINEAKEQPTLLPLPRDKRLVPLLRNLEHLPPELQVLQKQVGASGKTIGRILLRETGMGYQQWRQQWRLMRAIELLATGRGIAYCAFELGFASESALIAFFKTMTGTTPRNYLK